MQVTQPGGYSLELTDRGETLIYRSADLEADAVVGWLPEGGGYRALLCASSLRHRSGREALPADATELVLGRMADYHSDGGRTPVTIDRSPPRTAEEMIAELVAPAEATRDWKREQRPDGTWVLRRIRAPA